MLDRIPDPVVEEMCQLVKANSIEGCKRASVMVVWTPWANLHKDETCMQAGAVGFHDSKLRRLRRVDKDKSIVKKLEKTRREAHPDLQQERLQYERDAIRWRKNRDKANRDSKNAREKAERDAARREIEERHAARDAFLAGANAPPPPPDPFLVDALEDARRDAFFALLHSGRGYGGLRDADAVRGAVARLAPRTPKECTVAIGALGRAGDARGALALLGEMTGDVVAPPSDDLSLIHI